MSLSHLDDSGKPSMVDVGDKHSSRRIAKARAIVVLSDEIMDLLQDGEIKMKKGGVFQTAVLAGVMAAKQTGNLIPLCHPLGLEDCQVDISVNEEREVIIDTKASLTGKTGVEMEALTAASIAALTIYDMCKAMSHNILIKEIKLMEKSGGKRDFKRE